MTPEEKRRFHRILCDGEVIIRYGEAIFKAPLIDLSLKGALTGRPENWTAEVGTACRLEILLDNSDTPIMMDTIGDPHFSHFLSVTSSATRSTILILPFSSRI